MGSPFSEKLIELMRTRILGCNSKRCMKAPFGKMQCIAMLVISATDHEKFQLKLMSRQKIHIRIFWSELH